MQTLHTKHNHQRPLRIQIHQHQKPTHTWDQSINTPGQNPTTRHLTHQHTTNTHISQPQLSNNSPNTPTPKHASISPQNPHQLVTPTKQPLTQLQLTNQTPHTLYTQSKLRTPQVTTSHKTSLQQRLKLPTTITMHTSQTTQQSQQLPPLHQPIPPHQTQHPTQLNTNPLPSQPTQTNTLQQRNTMQTQQSTAHLTPKLTGTNLRLQPTQNHRLPSHRHTIITQILPYQQPTNQHNHISTMPQLRPTQQQVTTRPPQQPQRPQNRQLPPNTRHPHPYQHTTKHSRSYKKISIITKHRPSNDIQKTQLQLRVRRKLSRQLTNLLPQKPSPPPPPPQTPSLQPFMHVRQTLHTNPITQQDNTQRKLTTQRSTQQPLTTIHRPTTTTHLTTPST